MWKPRMTSQQPNFNTKAQAFLFLLIKIIFLIIFAHGFITAADSGTTRIGAIIDTDSRVGKEQKTAMEMSVQQFNNYSKDLKLSIHFQNSSRDPLQAASAARKLIKGEQVEVIIGMQTWQEAALVADIGNRAQVPIVSFAAAAITQPSAHVHWPFLVQMAPNTAELMNCAAAMIYSYNWRRVIAIYEDDMYGGVSGKFAMLSEALQGVGTEIEYRLVLPPISSLPDPQGVVHEELAKLLRKQCRVFVLLQTSLELATHLFREAKQIGLMGRDSVWIIDDTVSNLLDSIDPLLISSMRGTLGFKAYYPVDKGPFLDFKNLFRKQFRTQYPDEDHLEPGIYALRAYDGINIIANAAKKLGNNSSTSTSKMLLDNVLSSHFTGLSGDVRFHDGKLKQNAVYNIVNVVGKRYKELGFWSSNFGFSESPREETEKHVPNSLDLGHSMTELTSLVNWPGDLDRVPKGWAMPTDTNPLKIGVPGRTSFEKFVKVHWDENPSRQRYSGFCIDVFMEVLQILEQNYTLPYEFIAFNDTYDALVDQVINQTFDAVVGDVTILANRSKYVDFTQPYAESGLSMLVPVKSEPQSTWMFMKPFNREMWLVTCGILFYTMFVVWCIEHYRDNKEFRGPWKAQIGTALWFTFSSLFFAHREKIDSNLTKVVVVVWLFLVFVLSSTYQASLTSMLTVPRLEPNVTDVEWIRRTNSPVGCDGDSFVRNYLRSVLKLQNIKNISDQHDYPEEFTSGNIRAAFLELPYEKVFLKEYCKKYTPAGPTYRFGGLGFVFKKGSPLARDVSEAILTMSENGVLRHLEEQWFGSSQNCSDSDGTTNTESLSLASFWGLYLVSGTTSTVCFLIFLVGLMMKNYRQQNKDDGQEDTPAVNYGQVWSKTSAVARYLHNGVAGSFRSRPFASISGVDPAWVLLSPSDPSEHFVASPPAEIEIPMRM